MYFQEENMHVKKKLKIFYAVLMLCAYVLSPINVFAVDMIEVSVDAVEVKESKQNTTGVTWSDSISLEESLKGPLATQFNFANPSPGRGIASNAFSIGTLERPTAITATIRALIKDNSAKVLANPKLATESGSQASFLVGGEIPVPVVSPQGTSIEWKTYGINLQIKPESIGSGDNKKISAMIQVSVSDLDYANSVKLSGYDVPALLNRSANSKVTVDDGGTAVIAGLKQTKKEKTEQRVPVLGSIPLVGWFFRGTSDITSDTSMVIFVTFKIVSSK
jgi:pilus assembly protein CpaC